MIFSGLDDLSLLDHVDAIGVDDRGQVVRDDHAGDASELARDALGDDGLSQVVECAGGLVEHQDARAADDGPGDQEPLTLAAGLDGRQHRGKAASRRLRNSQVLALSVVLESVPACLGSENMTGTAAIDTLDSRDSNPQNHR